MPKSCTDCLHDYDGRKRECPHCKENTENLPQPSQPTEPPTPTMDFRKPFDHGDIIFIVEDTKVYANKAMLSMSSEVFKRMFTAQFAERLMTIIPLPGKKADHFVKLMEVLHPPHKSITDANVVAVTALSHEYQIQYVFKRCVRVLMKQKPSIVNLNLADMYSLKQLHKKCLKYAEDTPLADLKDEPGFDQINPTALTEILSKKVDMFDRLRAKLVNITKSKKKTDFGSGSKACNDCRSIIWKYDQMCELLK